jgi:iron complex outermembrane receptor protein
VPFLSGTASIDGKKATINATDFLNPTNGEDVIRHGAIYETQLTGDVRLKANLNYQDNQYWYTSITSNPTKTSGPGTLSDIPASMINGDVQVSFPVASSQYLVVGASANQSTLRKRVYRLANWRQEGSKGALGDWADGNSQSMAAYIQDEIALSDRMTVYGGARYDRWSTDGAININNAITTYDTRTSSAINPKASAVYRLDTGTVVKGAIGKAFRAPNLSDMYSTYGAGGTIYWSNPDLKPEKATTGEAGVEHEFKTGTLLRATYYRSDISDLIYSSTSGANRYKLNAATAEAEGIDLEARQKLLSGVTAFINATYVTTTITENSVRPASVGKQIPLQPRKLLNIGLEGSRGPWAGSVIGTYVGKMYGTDDNTDTFDNVPGSYDPYAVVNAKVSYRIDKTLTASFAVNNLFDRGYFLGPSKADGRSLFLGLAFRR